MALLDQLLWMVVGSCSTIVGAVVRVVAEFTEGMTVVVDIMGVGLDSVMRLGA